MSVFTDQEIDYLRQQRLGRLATSGPDNQPHVVPVGFEYDRDADAINIGGHNFGKSKKFRDAEANPHVAFVVDDLASVDPWQPRGIEIRGTVETFSEGGDGFGQGYDDSWIQIMPERINSWGINEEDAFASAGGRSV